MAKKFLTAIDLTGNNLNNPGNIYTKTEEDTAHGLKVDKTTTVNGKPLNANVTLTTADIADSTNKRYVTDSFISSNTGDETTATIKTKLGITTLSGVNTGDQVIALTGDVTSVNMVTTIPAKTITLAKQADLAANSLVGNNTGAAGVPLALTVAQVRTMLGMKYAANIGNGALTTFPITHNLASLDVGVHIYEVATGAKVECDITLTDTNNVSIAFATAPTSNQYRVVVFA